MNFFTEIKEGLAIAWDAIRANKLRSILTALGVIIGIITVTLMGAAIDGMNRAFHKSISAMGADVLYVNRIGWFSDTETDWLKQQKRRNITLEQSRELARQLTLARAVSPMVFMNQTVSYHNQSAGGVFIIGTTEQFVITDDLSLAQGRFLTAAEAEGGRPVCVIGLQVATNLFFNESPLGKHIKVGPRSMEVVGVLERRGSFLGLASLDNQVIIPVQQLLTGYLRNPDVQIEVKVNRVDQMDDAKEELRGAMRKIRRVAPLDPDDFAVNQQEQFITLFNRVAGTIGLVGLLITGLSLFVGGIGIMNIMFVSVTERTREIGVRKAIGARQRTILLQFLVEAATLCLLAGLVGLAITWLLTFGLGRMLPVHLSLPIVGLAVLVSLLTGLISGSLPAWRAARMNPVDALRNE